MAQWRAAARALEEQRRHELRSLTAESALAATDALLALASPRSLGVERRTHSGLVEQQPETAVRLRDLLDRARG
jgi:hypothetical protein